MNLQDFWHTAIRPMYAIVPSQMRSAEATAMLLAIAQQESRIQHRKQIRGPARGFWQFEVSGVRGVLEHHSTRDVAEDVIERLSFPTEPGDIKEALAYNDVAAAAFARLYLYTHPFRLPRRDEPDNAWGQYLSTWRPGKPHPETWDGFFNQAWKFIQ